ncbi:MAG: GNAT family N-acetyltransferase [Candidatus Cloacimonetes bacterium]|nr:GNAT family N-acetyltransferase [Candidatus Cloacimonadota bacterium]MDD4231383.1 GNAT family N-acetyltransferase [Candidatus Cloacimonadota bacterium]
MLIRKYDPAKDAEALIQLIKLEGKEWICYWSDDSIGKYKLALKKSITYVAYNHNELIGYSRSLEDCGFYIYVCDLLVCKKHRGKGLGRMLMECIRDEFPDYGTFVMSDVDDYYHKLGYKKEGSVFQVS